MTVLLLIAAYLLYCFGLAIYRLYVSPLSKYPGPKLAAASWGYEVYYDVVKVRIYDMIKSTVQSSDMSIRAARAVLQGN